MLEGARDGVAAWKGTVEVWEGSGLHLPDLPLPLPVHSTPSQGCLGQR